MLQKLWLNIFRQTFQQAERDKDAPKEFDNKVFILFVTVAISLVFINYFGDYNFLVKGLESWGLLDLSQWLDGVKKTMQNNQLFYLTYWVFILGIFYLILPLVVIKFVLKERCSDYGLSPNGVFKSYKVYLLFFLFMFPLVILVSYTESFQQKYPFYDPSGESLWPAFIIWQGLYLLQFFFLEFFFRGFMVHGLKQRFGYYSIFIMMIPYCMIHFQKPMPETIGAIIAGIILGTLSLKSKSIWLGVAIHYSVAITMDIAALYQKGYFN